MTTPHMRAGHTDRQAAVDTLSRHFAEGRLDAAEFDDRVGKAYAATYLDEIPELLADLPENQVQRRERPAQVWAGPPRPQYRRPPPVLAVFVVMALAISLSIGAVTHGFFPFPILWAALILLFITKGHHRRHGHYHHVARR